MYFVGLLNQISLVIDCTCRQRSSTEELSFHLRLFKSSVLMNTQRPNTIPFTPESHAVVLSIAFLEDFLGVKW